MYKQIAFSSRDSCPAIIRLLPSALQSYFLELFCTRFEVQYMSKKILWQKTNVSILVLREL